VGLTLSDAALMTAFLPDFSQAGETKLLHKKNTINFCHLGTEMVTATRRACHLDMFWTTVIKCKARYYFSYSLMFPLIIASSAQMPTFNRFLYQITFCLLSLKSSTSPACLRALMNLSNYFYSCFTTK
jgi:hypothetical protein